MSATHSCTWTHSQGIHSVHRRRAAQPQGARRALRDANSRLADEICAQVAITRIAVMDVLGLKDEIASQAHADSPMIMKSSTGRDLGAVPKGPT